MEASRHVTCQKMNFGCYQSSESESPFNQWFELSFVQIILSLVSESIKTSKFLVFTADTYGGQRSRVFSAPVRRERGADSEPRGAVLKSFI